MFYSLLTRIVQTQISGYKAKMLVLAVLLGFHYAGFGQIPFNKAINDTLIAAFGYDILVEDQTMLVISYGLFDFGLPGVQRLSKHDHNGSLLWSSILANPMVNSHASTHDNNIIKTDYGYLIAGNVKDTGYIWNPFLTLVDTGGSVIKEINLADSIGSKPFIYSMTKKNDSVVIIGANRSTGTLSSFRPHFIEVTPSGRFLSDKILFTPYWYQIGSIEFKEDKIFTFGLTNESSGSDKDALIMVLDTQYNILFKKALGDPNIFNSIGGISPTPDGGFAISYVADSTAYINSWRTFIQKYDSTYDLEWTRTLPLSGLNAIRDLTLLKDNSLLFGGDLHDFPNFPETGMIGKIDLSGAFQWIRSYKRHPDSYLERVYAAKELPSGHLVFTGTTLDPTGQKTWLILTDSNGCILPSQCESIPLGVETETPSISPLTLYPNPAGEFVHLSLPNDHLPAQYEVYSLTGQLVAAGAAEFVLHKIDTGKLGNGLYVVRVYRDGKTVGMEKFSKH